MSQANVDTLHEYEAAKKSVHEREARRRKKLTLDDFDDDALTGDRRTKFLSDTVQIGSKMVIGGGLGLLAGVATIAVAASAAEVVVAGVITKIAGVVGGAVGLSLGLNKVGSKNKKKAWARDGEHE
jgi:hypothetical protein